MAPPIEGLSDEQEAHAKQCSKCRPAYEQAMKNPRDWNPLATCKQAIDDCLRDQRDRPPR